MSKIIIVLCAFIACAVAKPGLFAPLTYTAPLAYSAPLTYAAAPVAYANAHLDAAYASSRVDINENYNFAAPAKFLAPAAYAAPVTYAANPFAAAVAASAFAAPLKYTNAPVLL